MDTLNRMLERLQRAIKRERRFIADAGDELKTPIAAMRTVLETNNDRRSATEAVHFATALSRSSDLRSWPRTFCCWGRIRRLRRWLSLDRLTLMSSYLRKQSTFDGRRTWRLTRQRCPVGKCWRETSTMPEIHNLASNAVRHAETYVGLRSPRATERSVGRSPMRDWDSRRTQAEHLRQICKNRR